MKTHSIAKFIYYLLCTILLFLCISRGMAMPIQGDEAGTYIRHVTQGWGGFWNVGTANNHLLNTGLIWITTLFAPFSEAAIRLPTLLISAWFFFWYVPARLTPSSWTSRLIFVSVALMPYYFNEYLSMARGYGMASIFALCALNELAAFRQANRSKDKLYLSSLFISISCLASLTIFPLFILLSIYILKSLTLRTSSDSSQSDSKKELPIHWFYLIPMGLTLFLSIYTYTKIKLSGVATIAVGSDNFFSWLVGLPQAILTPLQGALLGGSFPRIAPSPYIEQLIGIIFLILIIYQLFKFTKRTNQQKPWHAGFIIVIASIYLIYILSMVGSYPQGRAWIPYWLPLVYTALTPIFAINQSAISTSILIKSEDKLLIIGAGLSLIAVASSLFQFESQFTYETRPFYYQYKSLMHHSRAGTINCLAYKDIHDEVLRFYYLNKEGPIKSLSQCPDGTDSPPGFMQYSHQNKEPFFNNEGDLNYR